PEVHHHDLALVIGQANRLCAIGKSEVRSSLADSRRLGAAIAPSRQQQARYADRNYGTGHQETGGTHISIIRKQDVIKKHGPQSGSQEMTNESENNDAPGKPDWRPVLGLSNEPPAAHELPARAGSVFDQPEPEQLIELTVIVPARNEEDCIGSCLE